MYKYDLEYDLIRSDEAMSLILNDAFAAELYCALTNMLWLKTPDGSFDGLSQEAANEESWHASFRYVGGMVADMRNPLLRERQEDLECYMSWYCSTWEDESGNIHGEGSVSPRVKELLNSMGWYNFEYN